MNPYRTAPGSDPPLLAGRDAELALSEQAISLTQQKGAARPIVLTGLRGMGKTALLRRFERDASENGAVVIAAEAPNLGSLTPKIRIALESARREIAPVSSKLKRALDVVLSTLPETSCERLGAALSTLNLAVRKQGRWLAIGIDEIQQADAATLDLLISTIHETAGTDEPVLFFGAGLRNAKQHLKSVKTYTERWRYLELGLLPLAATANAIQEPARQNGQPFRPDALNALARASMGYPFFVQEFASTAWSRRDDSRKTITLKDVEPVIADVRNEIEREFYREPLAQLTPRELAYVIAQARLGEGPQRTGDVVAALGTTTERTSSTRQQLVRKDIIYSPAVGMVEFRIPMMAGFVMEKLTNLTEAARTRQKFAGSDVLAMQDAPDAT